MTKKEQAAAYLLMEMVAMKGTPLDMEIVFICLHVFGLSIKDINTMIKTSFNNEIAENIKLISKEFTENEAEYCLKTKKIVLN